MNHPRPQEVIIIEVGGELGHGTSKLEGDLENMEKTKNILGRV